MNEAAVLTLSDFLLARIAEDEADADSVCYDAGTGSLEPMHERVLAECAAKRAIVVEHRLRIDVEEADSCGTCGGFTSRSSEVAGIVHSGYLIPWPCPTLRHLAAVYADHDDYRDEWKP